MAKRFLNPNQPLNETTHPPIEAYYRAKMNFLVQ
ncbi:hypothetical protein Gohar_026884 [Gossypium harknessii]|uniref:Uncharacterized protein n=1 Tax=Gossypium harknessii TaxID=34285 RepID=A0A7J9HUH1_9ROSI|nr:hypothetical protein [Gossypium harknessii]